MIGAVFSRPTLSLKTLEDIWLSEHSQNNILSTLQPILAKILLRKDQSLFLDTMKFVALLVSELYDKVDGEALCSFTERFLMAAHTTANRYFHSHTFDQNRYLDCISAILSVWTDCTERHDLVIPKFTVYTRDSKLHVLDAILQSLRIKSETKDKLLDQISPLSDVEIFVKYSIVGRNFPKHHLHSLSEQPSEDTFRFWLLKHNITTIGSVSEFLNSSRSDDDLLSALCRPFYSLPKITSDSNEGEEEVLPEVNPDTLFFLDRGHSSDDKKESNETVVEKSPEEEKMSVDESTPPVLESAEDSNEADKTVVESEASSILSPSENLIAAETVVVEKEDVPEISATSLADNDANADTKLTADEPATQTDLSESCIKIKNRRRGRSKAATPSAEVIVVKIPASQPAPAPTEVEDELNNTAPLTEDVLAALPDIPSVARSTRRRKNSEDSLASVGSAVSVDSIASRTRNRTRNTLDVIAEQDDTVTKKKVKTPAVKSTPKAKSSTVSKRAGLSRKISETIDETPQIPVRKTRSRKLDV